ncbi:MAG: Ig-like domain-containing protein, partial [Cyanobacteriota bacterium]|nr:Ig-like domain-containing protein [Cyanobacteriota bacterium]
MSAAATATSQLRLHNSAGRVQGLEVTGSSSGWLVLQALDAQSPVGTLLEVIRLRGGRETLLTTIGAVPQIGTRQLAQGGRQAIAVEPGDQLRFVARLPNGRRQSLQGTNLLSGNNASWSDLQLRYQDGRDGQRNNLVVQASLQETVPDWLSPLAAPQREQGLPLLSLKRGEQLNVAIDSKAGSSVLYGFLRVEIAADGSWIAINDQTGERSAVTDSKAFRAFARKALDTSFPDGHLYSLNQVLRGLAPLSSRVAPASPGMAFAPVGTALAADQGLQIKTSGNQAGLSSSQSRWVSLEVQGGRCKNWCSLLVQQVNGDGTIVDLGSLGGLSDNAGTLTYGGRLALELPAGARLVFSLAAADGSTTAVSTTAVVLGNSADSSYSSVQLRVEAGRSRRYSSLVVQATALDSRPGWATASTDPQRQGLGALLSVVQGETLAFSLDSSTRLRNNRCGFVRVERRADGSFEAIRDSNGSRIAFANTAEFRAFLRDAVADTVVFAASPGSTTVRWTVNGPSGTYAPVLLSGTGEVFVVDPGVNRDGRRHIVAVGDGAYAFEERAADQGSDWDYDDILMRLTGRWTVSGADGLYAPVQLHSNGQVLVGKASANSDRLGHINLIGENTFAFENTLAINCSNWDFADGLLQVSSYTPVIGDLLITGTILAGPVFQGVTIEIYGADGQLLGSSSIKSDGTYAITVAGRGDYRGSLLLRAVDNNAGSANFRDEVSGSDRSLNADLRALGLASDGFNQFRVQGVNAAAVINISPLTELAARQAGVVDTRPAEASTIQSAEDLVAKAFGLDGISLSAVQGVSTNSGGFNGRDGLSDGEKIGLVLAKLSGLDNLNAGDLALSLDQVNRGLSASGLSSDAAALVVQGRARALEALKTAGHTFRSDGTDSDIDTSLNRQLLGEVLVTSQQLDINRRLIVTGTALPNSTVTITFPDGTSARATADSFGNYSVTSSLPQPLGEGTAVQVQGVDGVSAPVAVQAPPPPLITGAGRGAHSGSYGALVVGLAQPGTTITLVNDAGAVLASGIPVAPDGSWQASLTPEAAAQLVDGVPFRAIAINRAGTPSAPSSSTVDTDKLLAALQEAGDGYVNAAERASDGNGDGTGDTPIRLTVPASAKVGDRLVTTITRPDGSTLNLRTTLTADDLAKGVIDQFLPAASLSQDGLWSTRSALLLPDGSPAAFVEPALRQFVLDTVAPNPPVMDPSNGSVVSGQTEAGAVVTVYDADGRVLGTSTADSQGYWSVTPLTPLAQGARVSARATDTAGNPSQPSAPIAVDQSLPIISGALDDSGSQQGLVFDGGSSDDTTPELMGLLAAPLASGQQLALYRLNPDGSESFVGYPTVGPTGSWRQTEPSPLVDGAYAYIARVEAGGLTLSSSAPFNLGIDTTAPGAPDVVIPEAADGVSRDEANDGVALVVDLPVSAALGDYVITTVIAPDGSRLQLSTVLSADDLAAGKIIQTVPAKRLLPDGVSLDGPWSTSTSISDGVGNSSPVVDKGFRLAATAPSLSLDPVDGDNQLNGASANGAVPLSGRTSAEPGQVVTFTLRDTQGQLLGTLTALVQPDGTFSVALPQAQLPADGTYTLQAEVSNSAGTPAQPAQQPFSIDTISPALTVLQVAGDALNNAGVGVYNAAERGPLFDAAQQPTTTVAQPLRIGGDTSAEPGQELTLTLNGRTYRTTVLAGSTGNGTNTWQLQLPDADAIALNHGNIYPIVVLVHDKAGNLASSTTTSLQVDVAPPGTPTIEERAASSQTPTLTGLASKLDPSNPNSTLPLADGDQLSFSLNGVTVTARIDSSQPQGTTTPGVRYDRATGRWSLDTAIAGSFNLSASGTYDVVVQATAGGVSRSDVSRSELRINTTPPTITLLPLSADGQGAAILNGAEKDQPLPIGGTTTAEVGSTVTITGPDGIARPAIVEAGPSGGPNTFSLLLPSSVVAALAEGQQTFLAAVTNAYGLSSTASTAVLVDTLAPASPLVQLPEASDGLISRAEALSADGTPINVTLASGAAVGDTVTTVVTKPDGTVLVLSAVLSATDVARGSISQLIPTAELMPNGSSVLDGPWSTSTTHTDQAGNSSAPSNGAFRLDTTAPASPGVNLPERGNGINDAEARSVGGTPLQLTLPADAQAGDTITTVVTRPDGTTFYLSGTLTAADIAAGSASLLIPTAQLNQDGAWSTSTTLSDAAGNSSDPAVVPFQLDRTAPSAPTAALAPSSDSGAQGDRVTADTTPSLTGSGTPGDTITVLGADGQPIATAIVQLDGSWLATPASPLPEGLNNLAVTATDPAGNTSAPTALPITIDTLAPAAPSAALAPASDSGSQGDRLTNDTTPSLNGSGTPGDTITVLGADGQPIATAIVQPDGSWSATPASPLPEGLNNLAVTATDPAGNTSEPTPLPLQIDTTVAPPTINPGNGTLIAGTGEPGATLTLTEANGTPIAAVVVAADGTWQLPLTSPLSDGTNLRAIQVDAAGNTSGPGNAQVNASIPTIDPSDGTLLTGTGKPGDRIALTLADGTPIRDASGQPLRVTVAPDGTWTATPGTPIANGTLVKATNLANGNSASTTVDNLAPLAPSAELAAASDTGVLGDRLTADSTPTLEGKAEPGSTITIRDPQGQILGTTTAVADGSWTFTPTNPLPEGLNTLSITATDRAGNTSPATPLPITIDTTAPAAPTAELAAASDSGIRGDRLTNDTTPTLNGSGSPGDTITVRDPFGRVIATALVQPDSSWSATPASPLPEGLNTLAITATDPAGNTGPSTPLPITIDSTAPERPLVDALVTPSTTPVITGSASLQAGDSLTVAINGATYQVNPGPDGRWSLPLATAVPIAGSLSPLVDGGTYAVTATVTDAAGNQSSDPSTNELVLDASLLKAPVSAPDLIAASDSGASNTDNNTSDSTPTFTIGPVPNGLTPALVIDGQTVPATVSGPDANGDYSLTPTAPLSDGNYNAAIVYVDPAGNTSPAGPVLPLIIDTVAPSAPGVVLPEAPNGVNAAEAASGGG